jgi:hypothetical protein
MGVAMVPLAVPFEALLQCTSLGAISGLAFYFLLGWNPFIFFGCNFAAWIASDYILIYVVNGSRMDCPLWEFLLAALYREFNSYRQVFMAACQPVIRWRTGYYRLRWGGKIKEVMPLTPAANTANTTLCWELTSVVNALEDGKLMKLPLNGRASLLVWINWVLY